jgi:hypothetical protein
MSTTLPTGKTAAVSPLLTKIRQQTEEEALVQPLEDSDPRPPSPFVAEPLTMEGELFKLRKHAENVKRMAERMIATLGVLMLTLLQTGCLNSAGVSYTPESNTWNVTANFKPSNGNGKEVVAEDWRDERGDMERLELELKNTAPQPPQPQPQTNQI